MNSTTVPVLRYRDAEQAISWLVDAFGFAVFLKVKGDNRSIEHARLTLETNMIMLASIDREGGDEEHFKLPGEVGGVTQSVYMTVSDPDRIYRSAQSAGAKIFSDISASPFGGRLFSCADIEFHEWVFGTGDLWKKTW